MNMCYNPCEICGDSEDCEIRKIQLSQFDDSIPLLNKIESLGRMSVLLQNGACSSGLSDSDFTPELKGNIND